MTTWQQAEPMAFTRHRDDDGVVRITVDRFPPVIVVDQRFLDAALLLVERHLADRTIRFSAANGSATYAIVAHDALVDRYLCEMVEQR